MRYALILLCLVSSSLLAGLPNQFALASDSELDANFTYLDNAILIPASLLKNEIYWYSGTTGGFYPDSMLHIYHDLPEDLVAITSEHRQALSQKDSIIGENCSPGYRFVIGPDENGYPVFIPIEEPHYNECAIESSQDAYLIKGLELEQHVYVRKYIVGDDQAFYREKLITIDNQIEKIKSKWEGTPYEI